MEKHMNKKQKIQIPADTIKVILPTGYFEICPTNTLRRWAGISTATASREDKLIGLYRPRVKLNHWTGNLTIEFSVPKLLFGNNLQMVCATDLPIVLEVLQSHLQDYGIETTTDALASAKLHRADEAFNIYLPKSISVTSVLDTLNRCLTSGHKNQFRIQYENGGTSLRIGNASSDLLLYDKLQAPESIGGVDYIDKRPMREILSEPDYNILRIEKRFTTRKTVRKIFALYGICNPVLADIFHPTMGRDILLTEWETLLNSFVPPAQFKEDQLTQLLSFFEQNPSATPRQALVYMALQQLLEDHAVWDIKEQLLKYSSYQTITNLFDEIKRWKMLPCPSAKECLDWITEALLLWSWVDPTLKSSKVGSDGEQKPRPDIQSKTQKKEETDNDTRN